MIQDQLVDYVSSQMKLGVSRDAIKSALVSAGWIAGDVEDTLKKIEGGGAATAQSSMQSTVKSAALTTKAGEPQMIRVSDLVSGSSGSLTTGAIGKPGASMNMAKTDVSKFAGKISGNSFEAASPVASFGSSGGKKELIAGIVGGIAILGFAGLAWYFYSGNAGLAGKVASLTSESATVSAQLTALQAQLNASSTGFAEQIASLTNANADLALNLSFYATPLGGSSSTAAATLPVTVSGSLSGGGKVLYAVTTPRGAKILVANSADIKISGQLKPIVGHTVELAGTYIPGSGQMTVNSVTDLTPSMATSTASSTASSTAP